MILITAAPVGKLPIMTPAREVTQTEYTSVFDALADTPAEAENLKVRSQLMRAIRDRIDEFDWSQKTAAENLGLTQPRISDLKNGKMSRFSLDTLVNIATQVGLTVQVSVVDSKTDELVSAPVPHCR
ncbi:helix-turn-helix domain-containing protein [Nocardia africana]